MSVGKRISIVLSILWGLTIIIVAKSKYRFDWDIILFGVVVLVILWGIYWIALGAKPKDVNKENSPEFITEASNTYSDSNYEAKLKQFGVKEKADISLSSIILLIFISLIIGIGLALTGTSGKHFDLAVAIGFNLPFTGLVVGLYCHYNKIKFKSKHGLSSFFIVYMSLIVSNFVVLA